MDQKHRKRMMRNFNLLVIIVGLGYGLALSNAKAESAQEKFATDKFAAQCAECHAVSGDGPNTLRELWAQKGPNLSYAGNKYKKAWLAQWLASPTRIRPAGMFYGNHITPGEKQDVVDASTLVTHIALSNDDAAAMADYLMMQTSKRDLVQAGAYREGKISIRMGEMLFDKFRGCLACHQIEPGYGGVSGPEVYTAAKRLQEDYLISFMQNPQAWSPLTFMPNYGMTETDQQKFVHYFRALAEEEFK